MPARPKPQAHPAGNQILPTARHNRMAPQVGLESTSKLKINNMQGHGWHPTIWKAVVGRKTDRKWIAGIVQIRRGEPTQNARVEDFHGRSVPVLRHTLFPFFSLKSCYLL